MSGYSFADVLKHTGATTSQLKRWTDIGVIEAASGEGLGTGHHRSFSLINLVEVAVAKELAAFRIATPKLRELMNFVPLAVEWRAPRLWVNADGVLVSLGAGDPFVKKDRGLLGIALVEILNDIERKTGEAFPKPKGNLEGNNEKSVMVQLAREFFAAQRKKDRR